MYKHKDKYKLEIEHTHEGDLGEWSHRAYMKNLAESLDDIYLSGFGETKGEAYGNLNDQIYETVSYLESVIKQLNQIQGKIIMGKFQ